MTNAILGFALTLLAGTLAYFVAGRVRRFKIDWPVALVSLALGVSIWLFCMSAMPH